RRGRGRWRRPGGGGRHRRHHGRGRRRGRLVLLGGEVHAGPRGGRGRQAHHGGREGADREAGWHSGEDGGGAGRRDGRHRRVLLALPRLPDDERIVFLRPLPQAHVLE